MSAILLLLAVFATGSIEAADPCKYKVDLLILADGSESVCGNDLVKCDGWNRTLRFYHKVVEQMNIGISRVAMIKFGSKTEKEWDFKDKRNRDITSLLAAIDNVKRPSGDFDTVSLLTANQVLTEEFNPISGHSPTTVGMALMVTDGMNVPTIGHDVMSDVLHVAGVTMMVVCVKGTTGNCDQATAEAIASNPKPPNTQTTFYVNEYASLDTDDVVQSVLKQICLMLEACYAQLVPGILPGILGPIPVCNLNVQR